jgi:hypothetical protein
MHSAFVAWCGSAGDLASRLELRYLGASFAAIPAASFAARAAGRASSGRRSRKGASGRSMNGTSIAPQGLQPS